MKPHVTALVHPPPFSLFIDGTESLSSKNPLTAMHCHVFVAVLVFVWVEFPLGCYFFRRALEAREAELGAERQARRQQQNELRASEERAEVWFGASAMVLIGPSVFFPESTPQGVSCATRSHSEIEIRTVSPHLVVGRF